MMDPAGTIWDYASATQRENVQLKREVERERALANEAISTWKKTREERDEAREQRDRLAEACKLLMRVIGDPIGDPTAYAEDWLATEDEINAAWNSGSKALAAVKGKDS
jgi:hypothetical protein